MCEERAAGGATGCGNEDGTAALRQAVLRSILFTLEGGMMLLLSLRSSQFRRFHFSFNSHHDVNKHNDGWFLGWKSAPVKMR